MAALDSKYHIKIGDFGFLLARQIRTERHVYTREESPHFVNKFSSGDPNYRDATFFPHWAVLNWQNGFNQEFFDDGGRFYRSSGLDPTDQTKLTIQKAFNSAGQVVSGAKINCAVALTLQNATAGWYDTDYGYRKQLTVTAPATQNLPSGYPIKITEDTAALETAVKVRSDRKDWRVVYFNGSSYVDLTRHYINATETWFALQTSITANTASTSYFIYYGYAAESTTKQPSTADEWNAVYTPPDASDVLALWHVKETSGTTIADTSGNSHDMTLNDGADFATGKFGKGITLDGVNDYASIVDHSNLKPTSAFTIEAFYAGTDTAGCLFQSRSQNTAEAGFCLLVVAGKARFQSGKNTGTVQGTDFQYAESTTSINDGNQHHIAGVWNGSDLTVWVDGVQEGSTSWNQAPAYAATNYVRVGCQNNSGTNLDFLAGVVDGYRLSSAARTSFPHGVITATNTASTGAEVAQGSAPSASAYKVLAGASNGKIYEWDGNTTWTERKNTSNNSVNCAVLITISGTQYAYFGSGNLDGFATGEAKAHRTSDGSTYTDYTIDSTAGASAQCTAMGVYNGFLYAGVGPKAKVFKAAADGASFAISKDIDDPKTPGYIWAMEVYNGKLYVGGGHPQNFRGGNSAGFLFSFDDFEWNLVFPFDFTVIKSMKVYDSLLFIGTINRRLYVFNTANVDKIIEFPWDVSINAMETWQDKLAIALGPTDTANPTGNEAVYLFDRNGFHNAFVTANATTYLGLLTVGNDLLALTGSTGYVYKTVANQYQASGTLQSSYFEAQLPNIYKLYRSVDLVFDALPAGCTILVEYKTDESGGWTTLGTASTVGDTIESFNFGTGIYSHKISLRVTLASSNNTVTPTLRKVIMKYVLSPDFKYLWKMKLLAIDNIIWQDGTEPQAILGSAVVANDTSITLKSSDRATPTDGFPDPNGSTMYAVIQTSAGVQDVFTYTGKTSTTLTGIPSSGTYALGAHSVGEVVRVTGGNIHKKILDLKETRQLFTFTDVDGETYTVFFHSYQEDNFNINQDTFMGGFENEVPITLLEA